MTEPGEDKRGNRRTQRLVAALRGVADRGVGNGVR